MGLEEESVARLVRDLIERFGQLARKEMALAREEAREEARHGLEAAAAFAVAVAAALGGFGCLVVALLDTLGIVLPRWLAALCMGAILLLGAALFGLLASDRARATRPKRILDEARATLRSMRPSRVEEVQ